MGVIYGIVALAAIGWVLAATFFYALVLASGHRMRAEAERDQLLYLLDDTHGAFKEATDGAMRK